MVNELRDLMHRAVDTPPDEPTDLGAVLVGGRRAVRRRRRTVLASVASAAAVAVTAGLLTAGGSSDPDRVAGNVVPRPEGPVVRLDDAIAGAKGEDYDLLAQHTNDDLATENGQYFDGVTDDGLILLRDGPRGSDNTERLALLDPTTGKRDWLPSRSGGAQAPAVELGADRLVLVSVEPSSVDLGTDGTGFTGTLRADVFDRSSRTWSTISWPALGEIDATAWTRRGPDGRLYLGLPATRGAPSSTSGTPGPDGEVDDSGAEGHTYDLWSVSLSDSRDVRDERLRFGALAFTDDAMIWTEVSGGVNDRVHVRDLVSGAEHDFDPRSGERCNLLDLGATGDQVVLSQYCGDYDDGRDDRVQVLTTDGELVTTVQGDNVSGGVAGGPDSGLVTITSYEEEREGTYVLELASGRLVRVTDSVSSYATGGTTTPPGYLIWDTAVGPGEVDMDDGMAMDRGATVFAVRWRS